MVGTWKVFKPLYLPTGGVVKRHFHSNWSFSLVGLDFNTMHGVIDGRETITLTDRQWDVAVQSRG